MNNQNKLTVRSSKLKVHIANSRTISSYPLSFFWRHSLFFLNLLCFLSSCFSLFLLFCCCCCCCCCRFNQKYIFWYTFDYADGWVIKKIFFTPLISRNKTTITIFWGLSSYFVNRSFSLSIKICAMENKMNCCLNTTAAVAHRIYRILKVMFKFMFF